MPKGEKYTVKQVGDAITKAGGFVTSAAKMLNTSPKTVYDYLNKYSKLREIKESIEESYLDIAEAELLKRVRAGNTIEILFYLKTKGKKRGYVERTEMDFRQNEQIFVTIAEKPQPMKQLNNGDTPDA